MDNTKSKVLVLVEGRKTDYKLMNHLFDIYGIGESHEIVVYDTNIYTLYNEMFRDGDPASVDILQNLKEHERDEEKKKLFDNRYSDVLLIFDLDPQDPQFSSKKILEMSKYFIESSDMGKLYLNYPMVEAFYHMKKIPDEDYNSYIATLDELNEHKYKQRVNQENRNRNYAKFAVTKNECNTVIAQNIDKAKMLINEKGISYEANRSPDTVEVLEAQLKKLEVEKWVYVLCTCVFYIVDYNPSFIK